MEINSLRNVKTEALFVYLNTIVQAYLEKLEIKEFDICIKDEKQEKELIDSIKFFKNPSGKIYFKCIRISLFNKNKIFWTKNNPYVL